MPGGPDLFRALGALCEPPDQAHARLAAALGLPPPPDAATFTEVFVFQLVPYAGPYLSPDGMLGGEAGVRGIGRFAQRAKRAEKVRADGHEISLPRPAGRHPCLV